MIEQAPESVLPYPFGNVFAYWGRWVIARRLSAARIADPDWVDRLHYLNEIAGGDIAPCQSASSNIRG